MERQRFESLSEAFREMRTHEDNQRFIRGFVERLGDSTLIRYSDHFRVERSDEGTALRVHTGSTIGFPSEQEVLDLVGDVDRFDSEQLPGTVGVRHPHHGSWRGESVRRSRVASPGVCETCGMQLSLSGECGC